MRRRQRRPTLGIFVPLVDFLLALLAVVLYALHAHQAQEGIKVQAEYIITATWDAHTDADVDLISFTPDNEPVFYREGDREHGTLHLDRDSRGFIDDRITDPNTKQYVYLPHHEVVTMRGIIPGRYDFGIHVYNLWHNEHQCDATKNAGLVVHVDITKVNPTANIIFSADEVLNYIGDTVEMPSLLIHPDGTFTLEDPPITNVSDRLYTKILFSPCLGVSTDSAHTPGQP